MYVELLKKKIKKNIQRFCPILFWFARIYRAGSPFANQYHPMNYPLDCLVNRYNMNEIDHVIKYMGVSTAGLCREDRNAQPPRVQDLSDKIQILDDITEISDANKYLAEFSEYAQTLSEFLQHVVFVCGRYSADPESQALERQTRQKLALLGPILQDLD